MGPETCLLSNGRNDVISVTVRHAGPDDVDGVYELSLPFMDNGTLIKRDRSFYAAHIEDFFVIVAEGRIAACVGVRRMARIAEIINVAVGKRWQGRGLGQLIMVHVLAELAAEQFNDVLLFSKTTVRWFERLGFERTDQGILPPSRLALLDATRGSVPMHRPSCPLSR
jgi:N-acetylglutamate synthase-like GNAT family acetyltransferase